MIITYELFFQLLNTIILALIPITLILIIIMVFKKTKSTKNKIYELEKRINDLENR